MPQCLCSITEGHQCTREVQKSDTDQRFCFQHQNCDRIYTGPTQTRVLSNRARTTQTTQSDSKTIASRTTTAHAKAKTTAATRARARTNEAAAKTAPATANPITDLAPAKTTAATRARGRTNEAQSKTTVSQPPKKSAMSNYKLLALLYLFVFAAGIIVVLIMLYL